MAKSVRKSGSTISELTILPSGNDGSTISDSIAASGIATDSGIIVIDPATIGSGGSDNAGSGDTTGSAPKRRGRTPGSTNSKKSASLDINGVEALLFSAHALLAGISKTPEMALDQNEAKELAKGIANVSRHYDVSTSQKTMDIANLVMVCGMVYGSRILAIRNRRKAERPERPVQEAEKKSNSFDGSVIIPGVGTVRADGMLVQ